MIWTDDQLTQWTQDAHGQIAVEISCIWARECVPTTAGVAVLTLPAYVRSLMRVTWRGRTLTPQSWEELTLLTPATVFLDYTSTLNQTNTNSTSKPLFYALHPTNPYDIRIYPSPNESFTVAGEPNPYAPTFNSPSCIITYFREPDPTNSNPIISLPPYISRRTVKAYVLWKAFAAEGKGQDLDASQFYQNKYNFLISTFRSINEGCFVSKKYTLGDGMLDPQNYRYPKPMMGPNFERVIF
jgi:hypothetical protein